MKFCDSSISDFRRKWVLFDCNRICSAVW